MSELERTEAMEDLMPEPAAPIDGSDRSRYLGSSDIAATMGLSPWRTPLEVQLEKLGEIPPQETNDAMRFGTLMEPYIREAYRQRFGCAVIRAQDFVQHPQHKFLGTHLDGVAILPSGKEELVEIKTTKALVEYDTDTMEGWGVEGSDAIPQGYQCQVQDTLGLTGLDVAKVVVLEKCLLDWSKLSVLLHAQETDRIVKYIMDLLVIYVIERNPRLVASIFAHGIKWWTEHIIQRQPVAPVSTKEAAMKSLAWADTKGGVLEATDFLLAADAKAREAKRDADAAEKRLEAAKFDIMDALDKAQADTLVDAHGNVLRTWRSNQKNLIDLNRLRAEAPEIAKRFGYQKVERRLLAKGER